MPTITCSIEGITIQEAEAILALLGQNTKPSAPARAPKPAKVKKSANGRGPSRVSPESIVASRTGRIALEYIHGLKAGRKLTSKNVGRALERKGFNSSTAHPVLSALHRAGHIKRVKRGTYVSHH